MRTVQMTQGEVKDFGAKLDAFGKGLSPREQVLLRALLARAAQAGEVQGYDYPTYYAADTFEPFSSFLSTEIIIIGGVVE